MSSTTAGQIWPRLGLAPCTAAPRPGGTASKPCCRKTAATPRGASRGRLRREASTRPRICRASSTPFPEHGSLGQPFASPERRSSASSPRQSPRSAEMT
eukprot:6820186-Lingulodinium_polyedra.AAC.1